MKLFTFLSLISLLCVTSFGATTTSASEETLLYSCQALADDPDQDTAIPCNYYVQGYIAGALINDTSNALELASASRQMSAYMERVYRTRVGAKRDHLEGTPFLHFCIPTEVSESIIISKLSGQLELPIKSIYVLRKKLYEALQTEYPCR